MEGEEARLWPVDGRPLWEIRRSYGPVQNLHRESRPISAILAPDNSLATRRESQALLDRPPDAVRQQPADHWRALLSDGLEQSADPILDRDDPVEDPTSLLDPHTPLTHLATGNMDLGNEILVAFAQQPRT